ncbi:MAG: DNA polymerase I, partial [Phycisphaerales bacterium]
MPAPATFYLIDGHAHFFRAYHAIRTAMTSPVTQEPTHLTFGFSGMLLKLIRDYKPDYLAVVIDKAGDRESFRSQIDPAYKANRTPPPEDFRPQVDRCLELLELLAIPVLAMDVVEADDVIATIARMVRESDRDDVQLRIVSKDKDLLQIAGPRIEMLDVYNDVVVQPSDIFKYPGVEAHHVRDILALMGDSIDNVPGVPGIGPKTAAALVLQYGSIEGIYQHIDEIKGKRRENLEASRDAVDRAIRLVTLRDDCDIAFDFEAARFDTTQIDVDRAMHLFRELGFNRQRNELAAILEKHTEHQAGATSLSMPAEDLPPSDSLFAGIEQQRTLVPQPVAVHSAGDYQAVITLDALRDVVTRIRSNGTFAFDVETSGLSPRQADLCGVALAVATGSAWYVPIIAGGGPVVDEVEVLAILKPLLEDETVTKTGHNLKFDMQVLRQRDVHVRGIAFDTMVASYVLDAGRSAHGMDALALAHLQHATTTITELIGSGVHQRSFGNAPLDAAVAYAGEDVDIALQLRNVFEEKLAEGGLRELFENVEMPLVDVLAELEYNGVRVDPDELERQRRLLNNRIAELKRDIVERAPHEFNPDSPRQLAAVLFNKPDQHPPGLGIRPLKRGKTGPSTDVEVLERLAADLTIESRVPQMIVEYRQLTKLVNTYLVALKDAINPDTGRVHASFNQTGTATGRLSSSDPNLQNIPIRTEVGREIRRAFIAEPGNMLISADYSQIELRLLAHLSNDAALIDAFHKEMDIHIAVAGEVFGVAAEDVSPEQRNSAKMINFGIVYGITPFGLARRLGPTASKQDAARIITDYKKRFSGIDAFLARCIAQAEEHGYVETILGRRRPIPQIHARQQQRRALGERMAINTVVQGSAADLIKIAMIEIHRRLPKEFPAAKMILQIHDELVFEANADQAEEVRASVIDVMESAMQLTVPLRVESAIASNWIDAK